MAGRSAGLGAPPPAERGASGAEPPGSPPGRSETCTDELYILTYTVHVPCTVRSLHGAVVRAAMPKYPYVRSRLLLDANPMSLALQLNHDCSFHARDL